MNIIIESNGYEEATLQSTIEIFNKVAENNFPDCTINHFYYGDFLDMLTIKLSDGSHAHFNLTSKRISFNGYSCNSEEQVRIFGSMTCNDSCYNGKIKL